jgi:hypothetical protein
MFRLTSLISRPIARLIARFCAVIVSTAAMIAIAPPGRTGQLADGTVFFESATSIEDRVGVPGGRLNFVIAVPDDAREPLSRVAIEQIDGFDRGWRFDLDATRAQRQELSGDRSDDATAVAVSISAADDRELEQLTVEFAEPIAPGQRVTIQLRLYYTPRTSGVYQWRVQAFPAGERSQPQTLGTERFQFLTRPSPNQSPPLTTSC